MIAKDRDTIRFLLAASAASVALWFIPYAFYAVYPFRLFVTFIHEGGHALATLLTLGAVERIVIHADGSGVTYSLGGLPFVIANAGYLASTLYGAGLLVLCRSGQHARAALAVTAAAILAMTFFFAGNLFSWITGIGLTIGLALAAAAASVRFAHFFLSFLAIQCCLNALFDLRTLFLISTLSDGPSDARNLERMTFIPAIIWTSVWIVASAVLLVMALRVLARRFQPAP
ncbi:MAG: M50 family metallopeptidase [Acidobacteria bacterium]|nr:M50 family metallopeptidase [Acidobacteriota bacterium]MCW5967985.1 M50 family metallopeptidase [Blastocatellales bacterium]